MRSIRVPGYCGTLRTAVLREPPKTHYRKAQVTWVPASIFQFIKFPRLLQQIKMFYLHSQLKALLQIQTGTSANTEASVTGTSAEFNCCAAMWVARLKISYQFSRLAGQYYFFSEYPWVPRCCEISPLPVWYKTLQRRGGAYPGTSRYLLVVVHVPGYQAIFRACSS
eukprot:800234-Rhodomonas_salina.1